MWGCFKRPSRWDQIDKVIVPQITKLIENYEGDDLLGYLRMMGVTPELEGCMREVLSYRYSGGRLEDREYRIMNKAQISICLIRAAKVDDMRKLTGSPCNFPQCPNLKGDMNRSSLKFWTQHRSLTLVVMVSPTTT